MSRATTPSSTSCPEFAVRRETISRYFNPPLANSTFHDLVNKGKIVPMKGMRGFYLLNDSLRRLGLREVQKLPLDPERRSLEEIMRYAFTLIDRILFPEPTWANEIEVIDIRDMDHARSLANQHRVNVDGLEHHALKLQYFQGVLDGVATMEAVKD
jgi:hypothetical protein